MSPLKQRQNPVRVTSALRPQALKQSTNIILAQSKNSSNINKLSKPNKKDIEKQSSPDLIKQHLKSEPCAKPKSTSKKIASDENEDGYHTYEDEPYIDFSGFDEELYKKLCSLESADDGFAFCHSSEPLDF